VTAVITSIEPGQLTNKQRLQSFLLEKISPFASADVSQLENLRSIDVSRNFLDRMTLSSVAHYMHRSWRNLVAAMLRDEFIIYQTL